MGRIRQAREPGRARPYVTLVDTGLAGTLNLWLVEFMLRYEEDGSERCLDGLDITFVEEMSQMLSAELERRTF